MFYQKIELSVETGGCPHTAIREDASMNFAAIDELLIVMRILNLFSSNQVAIT